MCLACAYTDIIVTASLQLLGEFLDTQKVGDDDVGVITGPHTKKTLEVRYISSRTDGSEVFPLQLVNAVGCLGKVVMFCYCKINA